VRSEKDSVKSPFWLRPFRSDAGGILYVSSFTMKTLYKPAFLLLPLLALFAAQPLQTAVAQQGAASPTPTYDPLEEPPLPPNPTEYELGRNLYWHWCMTCHGDRGQGLTDEFRGIWEPEHQNCWGRGCHVGRVGDEGFPIPTVVPAVVNDTHLTQFMSVEQLSDYLEATHPPQSPGVLKSEEYHAIALFVFTLNGRSLVSVPRAATPAPAPTQTLIPSNEPVSSSFSVYTTIILVVFMLIISVLMSKRARIQK